VHRDTDIGGPIAEFPTTNAAALLATASQDSDARRHALETLIAAYWKPAYKYLRLQWGLSNEDAKDLTQSFLMRALEKDFFQRHDPAKASFRKYLRLCLDGFVVNERKSAGRIKRGGGAPLLSLDFASAEGEILGKRISAEVDADELLDREWRRSLFSQAVDELRRRSAESGKAMQFTLFERYDLFGPDAVEKPTYAKLGREFGLSVVEVTNHLAAMRRQFRRLVLDQIRATTGSQEEFRDEVRRLLGGDHS
jgi:DNA-directed RNA polymerase specialized sigma24 family protein